VTLRGGVAATAATMVFAAASSQMPPPKDWSAADDHRHMLEQLGIRSLRPGPSGNEQAPNHANYDEAAANPFPVLPDPLTFNDGRRVATPQAWWRQRRGEIVDLFEREVYGRVPPGVPGVSWTVVRTVDATVGGRAVVDRQIVGHVDNSAYPLLSVDIALDLVLPAAAPGPVPVVIMFRPRGLPGASPAADQLIAHGWGYASLDPASIQADNGAGLTRGIIGLVNKGQPRQPDDWGALRAWAWGASRVFEYLETDRAVDTRRIGIEGVSRYGKAALVTMAFDQRFAMVLVGSSGEGGAKLHRRNWGEAVENLTGSGEYHWMAGNFLKYGAAEASFGSRNAGDLPVDAHELIALCAPRLTFISYGVPDKGDARWLDHQGSFMAAIAAQPVFRLLGAKDLGRSDEYMKERMPPVNVGLLDGQLAWRQHDGGHTDGPNWASFIPWAARLVNTAAVPRARTDANSQIAHDALLRKATQGRIDLYFLGDSIVRRWGALDYPELLANWQANFFGWNAANFGWGADRVENMLWRLDTGELDGVNPKVIVILAGTNNVGREPGGEGKVADIAAGIKALLDRCRALAPRATIILTSVFPRNDTMAVMPEITRLNDTLARFANARSIVFLNVTRRLADADGRLLPGMMNDDRLHPTIRGYQVWADALKPQLTRLLGPRGKTDHAPPPTGDPAATGRR
jgi:lysophospholipase L1-like esterase